VKGEVDVYTAPRLREEILNQVDKGNYRIIVDLDEVDFMDSTGLAVLVGGLKRIKEHEGAMMLTRPKDSIVRILSLTGLNKVFPVFESVDEAISAEK
jgi:anti-sigma B factor antagonist